MLPAVYWCFVITMIMMTTDWMLCAEWNLRDRSPHLGTKPSPLKNEKSWPGAGPPDDIVSIIIPVLSAIPLALASRRSGHSKSTFLTIERPTYVVAFSLHFLSASTTLMYRTFLSLHNILQHAPQFFFPSCVCHGSKWDGEAISFLFLENKETKAAAAKSGAKGEALNKPSRHGPCELCWTSPSAVARLLLHLVCVREPYDKAQDIKFVSTAHLRQRIRALREDLIVYNTCARLVHVLLRF